MKKHYFLFVALFMCVALWACQKTANTQSPTSQPGTSPQAQELASEPEQAQAESLPGDALTLYESWPSETSLDNPEIADAADLWIAAIDSAQHSLDFSQYYAITAPDSKLSLVLQAIQRATQRGVHVRFIVDKGMLKDDNAQLPKELASWPNIELRVIDMEPLTGGVQHSKYFIVDNSKAFFGSQNFDWRSLEHISEMGAFLQVPELVAPLRETFEIDWALALNGQAELNQHKHTMPVAIQYKGEETLVTSALSPQKLLPDDALWDLPQILALIQQAKTRIDIQLLNYTTMNYDKTKFTEIDDALIAAAQRGVHVRLMVSDWSKRGKYIKDLQRLEQIPNIDTKMLVVPEAARGFIPFARTIHSKFMLVDQDGTWLGTSNWSGDYFYNSRNVGLVAKGQKLNADLSKSFEHYWESEYAQSTDPQMKYEERRRF